VAQRRWSERREPARNPPRGLSAASAQSLFVAMRICPATGRPRKRWWSAGAGGWR
jgi:hypothetical protein